MSCAARAGLGLDTVYLHLPLPVNVDRKDHTLMTRQQEHTPFVVPMEDTILHTDAYPFCSDPACPRHEDQELIMQVAQAVEKGLRTSEADTQLVQGQNVLRGDAR